MRHSPLGLAAAALALGAVVMDADEFGDRRYAPIRVSRNQSSKRKATRIIYKAGIGSSLAVERELQKARWVAETYGPIVQPDPPSRQVLRQSFIAARKARMRVEARIKVTQFRDAYQTAA